MKPFQHLSNFLKIFRNPLSIKAALRSLYYKLAPVGSKQYHLTYTMIQGWIKHFRLMNIRYQYWIRHFDTFTEQEIDDFHKKASALTHKPLISVIMPVFNPNLKFLDQTIQSVRSQVYPNWELCIADDASTKPGIRDLIQSHSQDDPRIHAVFRDENGHISAASNSALSLSTGEFIALLDHDDQLHPLALYLVAEEINRYPECEVIYSDEDKISKNGKRIEPYFKSDFDYDMLLSRNMVSHLGVYKTATVRMVGGFRIGLEGSQDYDLLLRIVEHISHQQIRHIPRVLYHWRMTNESVATSVDAKPYALLAGAQALSDHLAKRDSQATVRIHQNYAYKINYPIPDPPPSVEIFIKPKNLSKDLIKCIKALHNSTEYDHFKVSLWLEHNQPDEQHILDTLKAFEHTQLQLIDKTTSNGACSFHQLFKLSSADYVGLLDDRCVAFTPGWLENLISIATQPGVGAVSPKLLDQNGSVFSSGIVLGIDGIAQHIFNGLPSTTSDIYFGWSTLDKGYSALPAGCLFFRQSMVESVGSFSNELHSETSQVIDFCLKLKETGLRNILISDVHVTLNKSSKLHKAKGADHWEIHPADQVYFLSRWRDWIECDPAFNHNLTLHKGVPMVSKLPKKALN